MLQSDEYVVAKKLIKAFGRNLKTFQVKYPHLQNFINEINSLDYKINSQPMEKDNSAAINSALVTVSNKDLGFCGLQEFNNNSFKNLRWQRVYDGLTLTPYIEGMYSSRLIGLDGYYFHKRLAVGQMLMLPGVSYPLHTHQVAEIYYCISGKLSMRRGIYERPSSLASGCVSFTPTDQLHSLKVMGNKPVLVMYAWLGNLQAPIWIWKKLKNGYWEKSLWKRLPGRSWINYDKLCVSEKLFFEENRKT